MARGAGLLGRGDQDEVASAPAPRPPGRRRRLILAGVLVVALLLVAAWRLSQNGPAPLTGTDVDRAVQAGIAKAQQDQRNAPPDAAVAYRKIIPSLVTVTATQASGPAGADSELGAGVIVDARGEVLTALHVVAGGGRIEVQFSDGTEATAQVVSRKPESDIAVLAPDRLPE